jgi:HD-GYP domain-containing protein (c-di-GMP phosphodiesterase class II)
VSGVSNVDGEITYSGDQLRRVRTLLACLFSARRAHRLYPETHPANVDARRRLSEVVGAYHAEGVDVVLSFLDGEVRLGSELLAEESVMFDQLIRDFESVGAGSVAIRRGASERDLLALVSVLAAYPRELEAGNGATAMLAACDASHVEITAVAEIDVPPAQTESDAAARVAYDEGLSLVREAEACLLEGRPLTGTRVKGAVRPIVDNVLTNRAAMLRLTGLKDHDEYTYYHSANVAILSLALGSAITNNQRFLSALGTGSLLHDVGKLKIDPGVLNKPGALDERDWDEMRRHPVVGAHTIASLPGMDTASIVMILEHHMMLDGSGYPTIAPPRRPHLASRIVAVADAYDAMTSKRPYSAAWPQDQAMAALAECAGRTLDRGLVRLFIRVLGVYPPRSVVRLADGRIAIVMRPGENDPLRPAVRVIAAADGSIRVPEDLDLATRGDASIAGCLDAEQLGINVEDYL